MTRKEKLQSRIGLTNKTRVGEEFKIIEYNGCNNVVIEFPNGDKKTTSGHAFKTGKVAHYTNEGKKKDHTGEKCSNRFGESFVIVKYTKYEDVDVQFDDGTIVHTRGDAIQKGYVRNPNTDYSTYDQEKFTKAQLNGFCTNMREERLGERNINSQGEEMVIIEYRTALDMTVQFVDTGNTVKAAYKHFKSGQIKDNMYPSVYGVGIFGNGPYDSYHPAYRVWFDMIRRCYDEKWQEASPTYKGATVDPVWHNYQDFVPWYIEHFNPAIPDPELDKDLIGGKQKCYSPDNCCFLPMELNSMLTKNEAIRGDLPIGVTAVDGQPGKYMARLTDNMGKTDGTYLFYQVFDSVEEAFQAYKRAKKEWVIEQANKFKDVLEPRAYEALLRGEVNIDD